jgi:spermidine synthase
MSLFLLLFVVVMTASGLTYQLLTAALVTSLAGDSVLAFSTIIGSYLFALGVGSFCSRYIREPFSMILVQTGYGVGFLGGLSTTMLWLLFAWGSGFYVGVYLLILAIGVLVGLQLPLVMRQLHSRLKFKELVSGVLALDYGGAVIVSVAFPLFLVPRLGLTYTALVFGILNVAVALGYVFIFDREGRWAPLKWEGFVLLGVLLAATYSTASFHKITEQSLFPDPVIYAESTPYQRIVVTSSLFDTRLYLNNNLQFSSADEYRYHEALVIPSLRSVETPESVLILGGGDGLAAKLLLQDDRVQQITLVDLDPAVTQLFRENPALRTLNDDSLNSPKVTVINEDAFKWLESAAEGYDLILIDFPDPSSYSVAKLYTVYFYRLLGARLNQGGAVSVQCSSPLKARRTFWCIAKTLEAAGFQVRPYHAFVPSFGEWGYCLAQRDGQDEFRPASIPAQFVDDQILPTLFVLPQDMAEMDVVENTLFDQVLVRYFRQDWSNTPF